MPRFLCSKSMEIILILFLLDRWLWKCQFAQKVIIEIIRLCWKLTRSSMTLSSTSSKLETNYQRRKKSPYVSPTAKMRSSLILASFFLQWLAKLEILQRLFSSSDSICTSERYRDIATSKKSFSKRIQVLEMKMAQFGTWWWWRAPGSFPLSNNAVTSSKFPLKAMTDGRNYEFLCKTFTKLGAISPIQVPFSFVAFLSFLTDCVMVISLALFCSVSRAW